MMQNVFFQMLPILLISLGGYLLCFIHEIDLDGLAKILTDFFLPALIFVSLYQSSLDAQMIASISKASTLATIFLILIGFAWVKILKWDIRTTLPPLIFMNSGFLGIPLMKLSGGIDALNMMVVYDQIQAIFVFSLGIMIISGGFQRKTLLNVFKSPILWALVAGFFAHAIKLPIPKPLVDSLQFAGDAASPLAVFTLGVSLHRTKLHFSRTLLGGLFFRFVIGYGLGYLVATMMGATGTQKMVIVVATALPSAVFTSVLPIRYKVPSHFASTMVLISTIMGMFTIPISVALVS